MKKNLFIILTLTMMIFACNPKETSETAQDYHSTLISIQTNVEEALVSIFDAIDNEDEAEILSALENANTILADALKEVNELDEFDGTDEYKNEMIKLLSMYQDILENEIAELIDYSIYFDELADEEWDYYYSTNDSMLEKYEKAHAEFGEYQNTFAEQWEFTLE